MADPASSDSHYAQSQALFARAGKVIPGGIYGHVSPAVCLPGASPYYAVSADGCRYRDVDGHEYIDYMCGYGPIILGYQHPAVEAATEKQRRDGDCFNHPTARMVELAERLIGLVDIAAWAVFGKNGSDMTTWAVQLAREATGHKKILTVDGAYHGIDPWCTPGHGGLIEEDRAHIHTFPWNDGAMLEQCLEANRGEVAAVIVTPFHHPAFGDCVMPADGFFARLEAACRRHGALIIVDDIRAGFRLHTGGSHRVFGLNPDIICFCKALANGYALSAAVGREELRLAAGRVFLTGSYWNGAVGMAAALATLDEIERGAVPSQLEKVGRRFREGLIQLGERHGHPVVCSGPVAIPFMRFAEDRGFQRLQRFCAEAMRAGVFLHPHHNWFLCAAHTEAVIDETLDRLGPVFAGLE